MMAHGNKSNSKQPSVPATLATAAPSERSQNITWQGPKNQLLAHLIRDNYSNYLAPPQGQSKIRYAKSWANKLGILHLDPKGNKTKQNIDKLVSSWKAANALSHQTGFGSSGKIQACVVRVACVIRASRMPRVSRNLCKAHSAVAVSTPAKTW
jgi:hypothetical protein